MAAVLDLQSERYAATGGIAGEGATRTIGRPRLDPLVLMIREAVQNSWDAKAPNAKQVRFRIDVQTLDRSQRGTLTRTCFGAIPKKLPLADSLVRDDLAAVIISDRNTCGLGGPTRADEVRTAGAPRNFVAFFRNIGRDSGTSPGGGTYGFGKASLYYASHARTILVHTRSREGQRLKSRFMVAALGSHFSTGRQNYTGRHWWGQKGAGGVVEPLRDAAADRLANRLGMPAFDDSETGTSILVLDPVLGAADTLERALETMCETVLWYAWPRMSILEKGHAEMRLAAYLQGEQVPFPKPEEHPDIREFIPAMRLALGLTETTDPISGLESRPLRIERPAHDLGTVAVRRVILSGDRQTAGSEGDSIGFIPQGPFRHIAILRQPRLIVSYLEHERLPSPNVGYVGVFVADDRLNRVFADAEPVTHDDWNPQSLEVRNERSIVRVALRRIGEFVREFTRAGQMSGDGAPSVPLGAVSQMLAGLLPDAIGTGAELDETDSSAPTGGSIATARRRPRVEVIGPPALSARGGNILRRTNFRIVIPVELEGKLVRIRAETHVLVAGGGHEDTAPAGTTQPRIVAWEGKGFRETSTGVKATATVVPDAGAEWTVVVEAPVNALTKLRIVAET